jgi:hypothetical protein
MISAVSRCWRWEASAAIHVVSGSFAVAPQFASLPCVDQIKRKEGISVCST